MLEQKQNGRRCKKLGIFRMVDNHIDIVNIDMQPHQDIETDADDYQPNHRTKSSILYNIGV